MAEQPQVVLRYRDGKTQRTRLVDTDLQREIFKVADESGSPAEVPFSLLKAVFYPREEKPTEAGGGSQLLVEFADGEIIRGFAHYNPERNGFFLFPLDRSKSDRIFVVNSAIMSIEVEKL